MIELLAPAGDLEKLKTAVKYGADAVYFGGNFSLRAAAGNFTIEEIEEGIDFLHTNNCKGYLTLNIYAHNYDIESLSNYLKSIKHIPIDAFIISDAGILMLIKEILGDVEIHLSTQANTTNYLSARFWIDNGVSRIVTAREMSIDEIKTFRENIPKDIIIESFAHGAMCMSYSGRCLLSNFMTGRDANKGACTHPCRWKYRLVEEERPNEYYPIEEDSRGTYILNSKDLCMIDSIPEMINAGISSFKIEGRNKSAYYVATVVSAYRYAIDSYLENPKDYKFDYKWLTELSKASHREFSHGFYFNKPSSDDSTYDTSDYVRDYIFIGIIKEYDEKTGYATVEQRNKMVNGDEIEIFGPPSEMKALYGKGVYFVEEVIDEMYDDKNKLIDSAPHPKQILKIKFKNKVNAGFIMRKKEIAK